MKLPYFPPLGVDWMMAVFPDGWSAGLFAERLTGDPARDFALEIRRNRRNGRVVTWRVDLVALVADRNRPGWPASTEQQALAWYHTRMREAVGNYGTSPAGWAKLKGTRAANGSTSDKVAWLNAQPCPPPGEEN